MSELNQQLKAAPAEAAPKKLKRGVSNQTQAVNQLKFHEKDAAQNGLFIGHLEEVRVDWSTNADSKSFTGMSVPRLTYHFASNHANVNERRHVYNTLFPVESNVNTIPNGVEAWKVDNILNWIKHTLDVLYLKSRQLTPEEEDALTLPFCDYDENNEYVAVDPQDVINGYASLFNNVVAIMTGKFNLTVGATPQPCYKDASGKPISLWMKLLRHRRRKNDWINVGQNGDLGFDQFIGSGVIELPPSRGGRTTPPRASGSGGPAPRRRARRPPQGTPASATPATTRPPGRRRQARSPACATRRASPAPRPPPGSRPTASSRRPSPRRSPSRSRSPPGAGSAPRAPRTARCTGRPRATTARTRPR